MSKTSFLKGLAVICFLLLARRAQAAERVLEEAYWTQVIMDKMAVTGFVTGLAGLFAFGVVLGAVAMVFSALALKRIKKSSQTRKGKGLAIAGLLLGAIGGFGALIVLLFFMGG